MKALTLRMKAFGSYLHETHLSFSELGENPLFLIAGNTGGGKTTLLDAMCFALYCRATGGRRSWASMRSLAAGMEDETLVEFVFSLKGETYRFYREQKHYPARGTGEEKVKETHECWKALPSGGWELLCAGAESRVRAQAEALLGLTCEQFSQVVVLPQGDFLRLLLSNSREKAGLLQTLFATEKWAALTQRLRELANALSRKAGENLAARQSILDREQAETAEALETACGGLAEQAKATQSAHGVAVERLNRQNRLYELAARLHTLETGLVRKTAALEAAKTQAAGAAAQLQAAKEGLPAGEQAGKDAQALREAYTARAAALEGARRLQGLRREAAELRHLLEETREKHKAAETAFAEADVRCQKGAVYVEGVSRAAASLPALTARIEEELRKDAAASVACGLAEGTPCPVCGSVHHPSPAVPSQALLALREEQKNLQKTAATLEAARDKLKKLEAQREEARKRAQQTLIAAAPLEQKLAAAEAKAEEIAAAMKGSETCEALEAALSAMQKEIAALEGRRDVAREAFNKAENRLAAAAAALKSAEEAAAEARDEDQKALEEFRTAYGAEAQRPVEAAALKVRDEAQAEAAALAAQAGAAKERLESARRSLLQLRDLELAGAALQERYLRADRLAKLLSGKTALRIPIQQFVLGIMLDDILSSANLFFADLSGGRYQLVRLRGETGGNAIGGLDLRVLDAASGGEREVETLSGGELFLASLSLAFGLSDVVQSYSGSVRLDSIFIDEGFGTLDQETLDTAMAALLRLQQTGRTVGIISHVTELESAIPLQVRVGRLPDGSSTVRVKLP